LSLDQLICDRRDFLSLKKENIELADIKKPSRGWVFKEASIT
jgi:hypothetical protein